MGSAVCKPSSVLMTIYLRASSPMRSSDTAEADGQPYVPPHLAPDGVYMTDESPGRRCALTAPFHPYQPEGWRYLSVALALESPPPAVSWHPALRCPDFPHTLRHAAIQLPLKHKMDFITKAFFRQRLRLGEFCSSFRCFETAIAQSRRLRFASV